MASLTIRKIEDVTKENLRIRAARNGRSMEAEVRAILENALGTSSPAKADGKGLYAAIREIVEPVGGFDIPEVPDQPVGEPMRFE